MGSNGEPQTFRVFKDFKVVGGGCCQDPDENRWWRLQHSKPHCKSCDGEFKAGSRVYYFKTGDTIARCRKPELFPAYLHNGKLAGGKLYNIDLAPELPLLRMAMLQKEKCLRDSCEVVKTTRRRLAEYLLDEINAQP